MTRRFGRGSGGGEAMERRYEILDLCYVFCHTEQHLFPVVLWGKNDIVLVDCGYPGSAELLEAQLEPFPAERTEESGKTLNEI